MPDPIDGSHLWEGDFMQTRALILPCLLTAVLLALPAPTRALTFSAATDFSATSNPTGVWSYGMEGTLGGAFTVYPNAFTTVGLDGWYDNSNPSAGSLTHNGTGSTIFAASADHQPGELALHPGQAGQFSLVRFTTPANGLYDVATTFLGIDSHPTTTDVHVLLNGVSVFSGAVNSYRGSGTSYSTSSLALLAGDTIDFAVGWGSNQDWGFDNTGLSATITQVPEPGTLGLAAFGLVGVSVWRRVRRLRIL